MYLAIGWTLCTVMIICTVLLTLNAIHLKERFEKIKARLSN